MPRYFEERDTNFQGLYKRGCNITSEERKWEDSFQSLLMVDGDWLEYMVSLADLNLKIFQICLRLSIWHSQIYCERF